MAIEYAFSGSSVFTLPFFEDEHEANNTVTRKRNKKLFKFIKIYFIIRFSDFQLLLIIKNKTIAVTDARINPAGIRNLFKKFSSGSLAFRNG